MNENLENELQQPLQLIKKSISTPDQRSQSKMLQENFLLQNESKDMNQNIQQVRYQLEQLKINPRYADDQAIALQNLENYQIQLSKKNLEQLISQQKLTYQNPQKASKQTQNINVQNKTQGNKMPQTGPSPVSSQQQQQQQSQQSAYQAHLEHQYQQEKQQFKEQANESGSDQENLLNEPAHQSGDGQNFEKNHQSQKMIYNDPQMQGQQGQRHGNYGQQQNRTNKFKQYPNQMQQAQQQPSRQYMQKIQQYPYNKQLGGYQEQGQYYNTPLGQQGNMLFQQYYPYQMPNYNQFPMYNLNQFDQMLMQPTMYQPDINQAYASMNPNTFFNQYQNVQQQLPQQSYNMDPTTSSNLNMNYMKPSQQQQFYGNKNQKQFNYNVSSGSNKSSSKKQQKGSQNKKQVKSEDVDIELREQSKIIQNQIISGTVPNYEEILNKAREYCLDKYFNYVIQVIFQKGTQQQKDEMFSRIQSFMDELILDKYGSRIIQKCLESYKESNSEQYKFLQQLLIKYCDQLMVNDQDSYLIQTILDIYQNQDLLFFLQKINDNLENLINHKYGCLIVQKVIEIQIIQHEEDVQNLINQIVEKIILEAYNYSKQDYSNYVIQHILQKGRGDVKIKLLQDVIKPNFVELSKNQYSSNVIEKSIIFCHDQQFRNQIWDMLSLNVQTYFDLLNDKYGNYVIQRIFEYADPQIKQQIYQFTINNQQLMKVQGQFAWNFMQKNIQAL